MATAAVETAQEIRAQSYVGFETITRQIEHKLLKRGFQFNVMVVGPSPKSNAQALFRLRWFNRANRSWKIHHGQHDLRLPLD